MKIAIIEDERMEREQMTQCVREIADDEGIGLQFEVEAFSSMNEFESLAKQPDLLILDLHLPDGNGLELARRLKIARADIGVIIITAYQEHVYEGYEVGAFRFLPKPVEAHVLKDAVLQYVDEYRSMKALLVPTETQQLVVALDDVVCIESQGRHSVIYFQDGRNIDSARSITDYEREIENRCFVRVHRRYLVNMKHIIRLKDSKIVFDSDCCHAEISRRNRSAFEARFAAYLKTR
ncbi:MAG: response regulator transcription factor [Clostridia bacterium]|nr:response regulator transcription factor [Clostridia bacterium]